jgi:aryl-alcohol dehydrogenase-like predicted oxidoreductase
MQKRKLGYTDLNLTVIGLGAWAIGGAGYSFGWGPQDDKESMTTIHEALEEGINWIDTAPAYGLGRSERVVGQAIKGRRDKVIIATKCGLAWDEGTELLGRLKKESIRRELEDSLRRLQVEVIDLYQIHWPNPQQDIEEAWGAIAELIKAGKIRYGGVSNFTVAQIKRVQPIHPVASLQPPYSLIRREVEIGLLGYCAANKIGVIAYSPLQSGLFTGKFTRDTIKKLPADDWRRDKNEFFQEPQLTANLDLVEGLRALAKKKDRTVAQLAIAWTLRRPEMTAAIVGARHPGQIKETIKAGDWILSEEEIKAVEELLKERLNKLSLKK